MSFRKLFEHCQIGCMNLKGRTVAAPMTSLLISETEGVSGRLIQYYRQKAAGGVALIIVETAYIDTPRGKGLANELCIDSDRYISRHSELTEAVHQQGIRIGAFSAGIRGIFGVDVARACFQRLGEAHQAFLRLIGAHRFLPPRIPDLYD